MCSSTLETTQQWCFDCCLFIGIFFLSLWDTSDFFVVSFEFIPKFSCHFIHSLPCYFMHYFCSFVILMVHFEAFFSISCCTEAFCTDSAESVLSGCYSREEAFQWNFQFTYQIFSVLTFFAFFLIFAFMFSCIILAVSSFTSLVHWTF